MHRRRAVTAALLTATITAGSFAAALPAGAADDDGDKSAELAEAQFMLYLLVNTDLAPSDVTCTRPPIHDLEGSLLCFALVDGRNTVAAVATLESPGVYRFIAIDKIDSVVTPEQVAPVPEPSTTIPTTPSPEPPPSPETTPPPETPAPEAPDSEAPAVELPMAQRYFLF